MLTKFQKHAINEYLFIYENKKILLRNYKFSTYLYIKL